MMKRSTLLALSALFTVNTFAQDKLKNVQEGSSWAPTVKVDGKLGEWNDTFHAYNKSTKLYYTISNDDKNLYLTVKSTDATNNAKIQAGGITFTLNTAGKKKEEESFIVTYPVVTRGSRGQRGGGGSQRGGSGGGFGGFGGFGGGNRPALSDSATKAALDEAHKQFVASSKTISAIGFKDITDTVISIYNEYGIKASIGYNDQSEFTYELAIPLKQLNISLANTKEMAYNVKLNGFSIPSRDGRDGDGRDRGNSFGGGGGGGFSGGGGGGRGGSRGGGGSSRGGSSRGGSNNRTGNIDFAELITPTDFWGKYALAQKVETIAKP